MSFPPKEVPSKQTDEKEGRGFVPVEIAAGIAIAFCLVAAVVPQVQRYAERYEYAAAVGDGATFAMGAFFCLVLAVGVTWVAARLILKSEVQDRLERDRGEGGAPTAG